MRMLKKWQEIDIEQALPLLSFMFCANSIYQPQPLFPNQYVRFNEVRTLAVRCLEKNLGQISLIMLQLVQAFRYENFQNSPLRKFLLHQATQDEALANSF